MLRNFLLLPFFFVLSAEPVAQRLWLSIPRGGSRAYNWGDGSDLLSHVTATADGGPDLGE